MAAGLPAMPVTAAARKYQLDDNTRAFFESPVDNLADSDGFFLACNKVVGNNIYTSNCILSLKSDRSGTRLAKPFQKANANSLQKVVFESWGEPGYYKIRLGTKYLKGTSGVTSYESNADVYKVYTSVKSNTVFITNSRTHSKYQVWGKGTYWRLYHAWF